jgi:hypothetical protein
MKTLAINLGMLALLGSYLVAVEIGRLSVSMRPEVPQTFISPPFGWHKSEEAAVTFFPITCSTGSGAATVSTTTVTWPAIQSTNDKR